MVVDYEMHFLRQHRLKLFGKLVEVNQSNRFDLIESFRVLDIIIKYDALEKVFSHVKILEMFNDVDGVNVVKMVNVNIVM